jgi:uncharacterized protein (DUF1697 family)
LAATTWVALLRGINVGRNKRVAMADLRSLVEGLGHGDVSTLLQSGNVVFTTPGRASEATLARGIEKAITSVLDLKVRVFARSVADLRKVVDANPFEAAPGRGKDVHVAFFERNVAKATLADLRPEDYAPDELAVGDRVLYFRYRSGLMGSALPKLLETVLDDPGTSRNWNTVTKLLAKAESVGG